MNGKKVKALRKQYGIPKDQKVGKELKATVSAQARTDASQNPKLTESRIRKHAIGIKRLPDRIALIERPLRHIHARYPDFKNEKGEISGFAPMYELARLYARDGDGAAVNRLARSA